LLKARREHLRFKSLFFINANGVVEISANDVRSGVQKSLTINHAYLSADERRSQQGTSIRRRRRRRSALSEGERNRPSHNTMASLTPDSSLVKRKSQNPAPERQLTAKAKAADPQPLAPQPQTPEGGFVELNVETELAQTISASGGGASQGKPISLQPDRIDPVRIAPGDSPDGGGETAREIDLAENAETSMRATSSTAPEGIHPGIAAPIGFPGAPPFQQQTVKILPVTQIPPELEPVINKLIENQKDEPDSETYAQSREGLVKFCHQQKDDWALQLLLARFYIFIRQAEASREVLVKVHTAYPELTQSIMNVYDHLCRDFPDDIEARRDRASLAGEMGNTLAAIEDMESVANQPEAIPADLQTLVNLYQTLLASQFDTTLQFKLIKLHLRRQDFDDAIGLLQQLVPFAEYRDRANKILGMCFWQKGLRYLAWQKIQHLPMDEEMEDILYRLGCDMEQHDELLHAKYALERLVGVNITYLDVAERLKQINDRLDLQKSPHLGGGGPISSLNSRNLAPQNKIGGRFEVINEINRGSMGIVYKARDLILDEIVAIKVLNDFLCSDPDAVERFKQEARSARRLTHQNIVRIHDMFEIDSHKIISMEYLEGDDLKTLLARNITFCEDMVLTYLIKICEGLAYAHRLHIVHRDIKPANIMINEKNQVKITDFGIAKLLNNSQTRAAGTVIMGTPLYMAPEQIEGVKLDHRCDIYCLGIMLYELVSGRPPFQGGNIENQHLHDAPPQIGSGITQRLRKVIMKCIAKKPEDRFQSADEILAHIV
jgi:hypothetical protein